MNHQMLKDYALALQLLGAKTEVCEYSEMVIATTKGQNKVRFWISDKYGLFGVAVLPDGSMPNLYSFHQIREALGLTETLRPSVILIRALRAIGLDNRGVLKDFRVHGEYSFDHERVRTIADFYGKKSEKIVAEHWSELKGALDVSGYSFELHDCGGALHYVSN